MVFASNTVPKAPVVSEELHDNYFVKDPTGYWIKIDPDSSVVITVGPNGIRFDNPVDAQINAGCNPPTAAPANPDALSLFFSTFGSGASASLSGVWDVANQVWQRVGGIIKDNDCDTRWLVEETPDDDIIRGYVRNVPTAYYSTRSTNTGYNAGTPNWGVNRVTNGAFAGYNRANTTDISVDAGVRAGFQADGNRQTNNGYQAGYEYVGNDVVNTGSNTGFQGEGNRMVNAGNYAYFQGAGGIYSTINGSYAAYQATRVNRSTVNGDISAYRADIFYSTINGFGAARDAVIDRSDVRGYYAASYGDLRNTLIDGYYAGHRAELVNSDGRGYYSLHRAKGTFKSFSGLFSGYYSYGDRVEGFGGYALDRNAGDDNAGFGYGTMRFHASRRCTAAGNFAGSVGFQTVTFPATTTGGNSQITIPGHGFGAAGDYFTINPTASTITGLNNGGVYVVEIIDANTVQVVSGATLGAGSATIRIYEQYENSSALGYGSRFTNDNQVVLGNTAVRELRTTARDIITGPLPQFASDAAAAAALVAGQQYRLNGDNVVRQV